MNNRGFTMIELLISTAIFAIILTALTVAFIQQQRQSNFIQEDVDLDQTGRTALNYVAAEIRNTTARQGKSFSLKFVNGGSLATGCDTKNTSKPGTVNSPPDCLTVYTWDLTRGEDTTQPANPLAPRLPSTPGAVSIVSTGPPLVLQLPSDWFPVGGTPLIAANDLIGVRSRINLCSPDPNVNCGTTPQSCTECSVILKVGTVDTATQQATIADNVSSIIEENFPVCLPSTSNCPSGSGNFSTLSSFINGVTVNGVNYGFIPNISSQNSEMTIVRSRTFNVDTTLKQLEIVQNATGSPQPLAGGSDAPGVVDLQFVFNLQDTDGGVTKVGVCSSSSCKDTAKRMFSDFSADPSLLGRQKDIRSVEIYLLVRSRVRPPLAEGLRIPVQTISGIGDLPKRTTSSTSDTFPALRAGYMYKVFSTTVYVRNIAREDFG